MEATLTCAASAISRMEVLAKPLSANKTNAASSKRMRASLMTFGGNAAYTPNDGDTVLRATYAEGFRAPTLSEGQPPFGNPDLRPETARNFDLGVEHRFLDGKAQVFATYFNRRSNDQITFSFITFQSENIGRAKVRNDPCGTQCSAKCAGFRMTQGDMAATARRFTR